MKDIVDTQNMTGSGAERTEGVTLQDETFVIINQAYGPKGEQLIGIDDVAFDGFPAISLKVKSPAGEQLVHLSPIHGDRRKIGGDGIPQGAKCELQTPSGVPLEKIGEVVDGGDTSYYAIYLTKYLDDGPAIYVSDVWGHYHSRVVDNNELVSVWTAAATV